MIFTLHRYIFRELMRVFVLASVALTLILSLGSILQPIQKYGVGAGQIFRLLGYFIPVTLTFVLPIAALFAASLVYGRFASDNEFTACKASGISIFTIVYPGLALAVIVSITNLILSFYVVPSFVQRAEKAVKSDARQIFFRNIERKGYYDMPGGKYVIYADAVDKKSGQLLGVVAMERKDPENAQLITAKSARIQFDSHRTFNQVNVIANEAYQIDPDGQLAYAQVMSIAGEFPSLLSDNVKFKKIEEMKAIQKDLMNFAPIAKEVRLTDTQLAMEMTGEDMRKSFSDSSDKFYELSNETKRLEFSAKSCINRDAGSMELTGGVKLFEYEKITNKFICAWQSDSATLEVEDEQDPSEMVLVLYNTNWQRSDGISGIAQRHIVRSLKLPEAIAAQLALADPITISQEIGVNKNLIAHPSESLIAMKRSIFVLVRKTLVQIYAEIHSRLVFGIGCIPLILSGIALGVILKGGHLLTAFGASSIPAAGLIVFIMMGKNVAKNPGVNTMSGILLMWAGLAGLIIFTLIIYRKLSRN